MEVNGQPLPTALVQAVQDGRTQWMFTARVNAYGDLSDCLDVELVDFEMMREDSPDRWNLFSPRAETEYPTSDEAGWLPYIHDLSRLVTFGRSKSGATFCLDYRDSRQEPAVISWSWIYWRRVAPNFAAFLDLLEPQDPERFWQRASEIIGHPLPAAFIQFCEAIRRGEAPKEWCLKEDVDAYGQPLRVPDLRPFPCDPLVIKSETDWMCEAFLHDDRFQQPPPGDYPEAPGLIQDFTGVANFVWFGRSTSGTTYAFDYGTNATEPSVVYYDYDYWRRVAPNFEAFIALFADHREAWPRPGRIPPLQPGDEGWDAAPPPSRDLLSTSTVQYVLVSQESFRPFFEDLARFYAGSSPEERRQVEADVRVELEQMGVSDEQRRTHEELWARLHATDPA